MGRFFFVQVTGVVGTAAFQKMRTNIETLAREQPEVECELVELPPCWWQHTLHDKKKLYGARFPNVYDFELPDATQSIALLFERKPIVSHPFNTISADPMQSKRSSLKDDDKLIGVLNVKNLMGWMEREFGSQDPRSEILYFAMANNEYQTYLEKKKDSLVYMQVAIDKKIVGELIFELRPDICPKTCANFRTIAEGSFVNGDGRLLSYSDTVFHRIVKNGWIQGGDIFEGHGDGGESIYGPVFADENFILQHDRRGTLSMANKGPHTNGSQFIITLKPFPALDKQHVVFGYLLDGESVLQALEQSETNTFERPIRRCEVVRVRGWGENNNNRN